MQWWFSVQMMMYCNQHRAEQMRIFFQPDESSAEILLAGILWMATMAKDDHHHRSVCVTELTRTLCATSCVCATLVEDNVKILGQQAKERTLVSSHCNMHYGARCTRTQSKQNACFVMLYTNHFISGGSSNSESLKGAGLPVSPSFPTGFKGESIDSPNQSTEYDPCV